MEPRPRSRARRAGPALRATARAGCALRVARLLAGALLASACGRGPLAIELPPPGDGARVLVVATAEARVATFIADARAPDAPSTLPFATVDEGEPVDLVVLDYDDDGAALGVDGLVDERAPGDEGAARRPLEPWSRRRAVRLEGGGDVPAWLDDPTAGRPERGLSLRRASPCTTYSPSRLLVTGNERPIFVRTTTTTALLAFPSREADTTWAALRAEGGPPELVPVEDPLPRQRVTALAAGQAGALFAATHSATTTPPSNRLWQRAPGRSAFAPLLRLPDGTGEIIRWIAPVPGGVWLMSEVGTITRVERGAIAWSRPGEGTAERDGALAAFDLERAVALLPFARGASMQRRLIEIESGAVTTQRVAPLAVSTLARIDRPDGPRVLAGTGRWGLAWLEDLNPRLFSDEEEQDSQVFALERFEREGRELLAYGGSRGALGIYAPDFGPCPLQPIGATTRSLLAFPGGILAGANINVSEVPSGGEAVAIWLERR